jgi:hypothetical protein
VLKLMVSGIHNSSIWRVYRFNSLHRFLRCILQHFSKNAVILVVIFAMMAMLGLDVDILRHEAGHDWEQVFNMDELSRGLEEKAVCHK